MGRREDTKLFSDVEKVFSLREEGRYIGTVTNIRDKGDVIVVTFAPEHIEDSRQRYSCVRAWLGKRYEENDLMDIFMDVFDNPTTAAEVIGKRCYIDAEYCGSEENPYMAVVDMEKI